MKVMIRDKNGESTLQNSIEVDFCQLLRENFTEVCEAVACNVNCLKELKALFEKDDQVVDVIVQVIAKSIDSDVACLNLQEELQISEMAARYLTNMSSCSLASLTAEGIRHELSEYRKQPTKLSAAS